MGKWLLCAIIIVSLMIFISGCGLANKGDFTVPPKGTPKSRVEQVFNQPESVVLPDAKQPGTVYVYSVLPTVALRVEYDVNERVLWSELVHLGRLYNPMSAKERPSKKVLEHDKKIVEMDMRAINKKYKHVSW